MNDSTQHPTVTRAPGERDTPPGECDAPGTSNEPRYLPIGMSVAECIDTMTRSKRRYIMRAFQIARAASGLRNHPSGLFVVSARLGLVAALVASAAACGASPGDDGEDVASQDQALLGTPGVTYRQVCYGVSPEAPLTIPLG